MALVDAGETVQRAWRVVRAVSITMHPELLVQLNQRNVPDAPPAAEAPAPAATLPCGHPAGCLLENNPEPFCGWCWAQDSSRLASAEAHRRIDQAAALLDLIGRLTAAMRTWGSWEDGVPEAGPGEHGEVGAAYNTAVALLETRDPHELAGMLLNRLDKAEAAARDADQTAAREEALRKAVEMALSRASADDGRALGIAMMTLVEDLETALVREPASPGALRLMGEVVAAREVERDRDRLRALLASVPPSVKCEGCGEVANVFTDGGGL